MPRKASTKTTEELKEKRPRKTRKEALETKIAVLETRLEDLKTKVTATEEKLATLKNKLEAIGSKESKKAKTEEQKQMAKLLQEKGFTLAQLEELLNKE